MIGELLPDSVVAVEVHGTDEPENTALYPEEEVLVARAVAKRRREFAVVRACARRAMEKLGVPPHPVLPGERGAPQWPAGLTGSMTHCDGYCAAALVRVADLASLGIDAEPHGPLPDGVLGAVSLPEERDRLQRLAATHPGIHWDRLLFSAKESVFKTWYPLTCLELDFCEAELTIDPSEGTFSARLLVPGPVVGGHRLDTFTGRWAAGNGLVVTVITVPATAPGV